ncbi:MAG: LamG domain-containing protein [Candidatus Paceibacterota bacterium]|jgi:prepilin-type N-terminal cleavage/methylation domain-containing protein|nr:LamG domain-containing protein [Candidatus Paceibacterota bacterium]MDD5555512.1 LamG domain-containing protein [Candidatus Paceibacterota bacterium]
MNKSFTLIEILVVIVIIGIISAFIIVSMAGVSDKAAIAKGQAFSNSVKNSLLLSLVSHYKLDGNTNDSWGTYNGTWIGPLAPNTTANYRPASECVSGQCLHLDGVDDWVSIATTSYASIHGPSTIDLWFKANSSASYQRIFCDNCIEWGIYLYNNTIAGVAYAGVSGGAFVLNRWYNIVLTHEHPTGLTNTETRIYVDGKMIQEALLTITTQNGYYDLPLGLGRDVADCGSGIYFNGLLDEVKIYKEGLSSQQVKEDYYSGLNKLLVQSNDMIEYEQRLGELRYNLSNNE